ncbi:MAG: calcium-binding protein [Xenococcaceae cyanobacterium MO_188.B19]|nr:calcium-binding protein [Xenococcaceae cyanobacterium MO_188.B19]
MALAQLNLENLDGNNGFIIPGIDQFDNLGRSVSNAGDINGDGIEDFIVGAPYADAGYYSYSNEGEAYVVFGTSEGFDAELDLTTLDGSNGFIVSGIDPDGNLGSSVSSVGDINGDGIDDLILGASGAGEIIYDYGFEYSDRRGEAYVIFGKTESFEAELDLNTLNGNNGFTVSGLDQFDNLGRAVSSAGDINGDGIDDIIIGTPYADTAYSSDFDAGKAYVVFGTTKEFNPEFDLTTLDGTNGFIIPGLDQGDNLGRAVSSAGDINGDGIDDLIIGSNAGSYSYSSEGEAYVVFGKTSGFAAELDLTTLNGNNGFIIPGLERFDNLGRSVSSAGDINGDGIDDLIIGAPYADTGYYSYSDQGEAYVVFGTSEGFDAELNLNTLNGTNGFTISGLDQFDNLGRAVSSAGDFNGDGFDDLLVSAPNAGSNNPYGGSNGEGEVYILFGSSDGFGADIDLNALDADDGFIIRGLDNFDNLGVSVSSAGDVNGDGLDDILVGAPNAGSTSSYSSEGEAYIIFGFAPVELTGTAGDDLLTGSPGADFLSGLGGNDTLEGLGGDDNILGGSGNDSILAGGGDDIVQGGTGADNLSGEDGQDILVGDTGNDTISGGGGKDALSGGDDDDSLLGNGGKDTLNGDDGIDTLRGGGGDDLLRGGSEGDRLFGQRGNDTIDGNSGFDILRGGSGNDLLNGGSGRDRLFGQAEDDILNGESGSDYLVGGRGNDFIDGGEEDDFIIGVDIEGSNLTPGSGEIDTLTGAEGSDTFVLGDADTVYYSDGNNVTAGDSDFALIKDFDPTEDRIQLNGSAEFYTLDLFTTNSGSINAKLIFDPGIIAAGEVIALIENVSPELSLDDPGFEFV